jgi:DNA-binding winged helix-turn-helix (wHTH) protein/tetratricopeptide (TPR) repeat protein
MPASNAYDEAVQRAWNFRGISVNWRIYPSMNGNPDLRFDRFRLDRRNQELRRDSRLIPLRPKTFAVLQYLAENPARLVTQGELLKAVWGPIAVGDGLLRGYIRDIRHALGDDAEHPRFIETIPRRGFRFLAEVTSESAAEGAPEAIHPVASSELVDRDQDLGALHRHLRSVLDGNRQVVFIVGEAGIGKTALLNTFLDQAAAASPARIACGQCIEQYGTREAYLPIFDALGRLCHGPRADEVLAVLARHAPAWLVQMPGFISDDQFEALQKKVHVTSQTRMLGEICEALEILAEKQPLILGLEDLQWSDPSTLDLLSIIARREEPTRLMVVASYRPADVIISEHPLRSVVQDLQAHRLCAELWPDYLTEAGVEKYLARRFPDNRFPARLKQLIHRNTSGNPLFVSTIVEELSRDKSIEKQDGHWHLVGDPEHVGSWRSPSLRHLIEGQLSRLRPGEQRVIEAAAVAGSDFTPDLIAAALEIDIAEAEECCDALVRRRQVLRSAEADSPDERADQSRYEFAHDLYRAAALERSSQARRRRWYQRIAEKIVAERGERADKMATELAYYFEHAGMPKAAAYYCALAGEKASQQFAIAEAFGQFRRGIELLKAVPASNERDALELRLQVGLALPLTGSQGFETAEVVKVLSRASELNQRLGASPQSFGALRGLYQLHMGRGDYLGTLDLCDKIDRVAERESAPAFMAEATRLRGLSAFFLGRLVESRDALERSLISYGREERSSRVFAITDDPQVTAASVLSLVLWMLGFPDQALERAREALGRATSLGAPYSIAVAHCFRAMLMRFLRDHDATIKEAESARAVCEEHGFAHWRAQASLERGWAIAMQGRAAAGIKEIRSVLGTSSLGLGGSASKLVDACLRAGRTAEGLRAVDHGLTFVREHKEGTWEPELHRLKGELLLQRHAGKGRKPRDDIEQAERCFRTAIGRARENAAKSFELRAATSMYKLRSKQGRRADGRRLLADAYQWFTEGLNTPDLVDARRMLDR